MIRLFARNITRFLAVLLLQVFIFDNVEIGGYLNPYFYVLFILLMPFETPRWLLLLAGFAMGLGVDLFEQTLGMHTAASVFLAFIRPWILHILSPRDGYEPETFPRIYYYGFSWFVRYAGVLIFIHHAVLFYLEVFHFHDFLTTFLRVLLSALLTLSTVTLSQYFIFRK